MAVRIMNYNTKSNKFISLLIFIQLLTAQLDHNGFFVTWHPWESGYIYGL